jgi:hypothetical protein
VGGFSSCKIVVKVGSNTDGYQLFINSVDVPAYQTSSGSTTTSFTNEYYDGSIDGSTNLVLVTSDGPPVVTNTNNKIPPFSATTASPADMSNTAVSAWGFAIPRNQSSIAGFDTSYTALSNVSSATATGKYAGVPAAQTLIRGRTGSINSQDTEVFFGTRASRTQAAGIYRGIVLFSVVGTPPGSSGSSGDNSVGEAASPGGQNLATVPVSPSPQSTEPTAPLTTAEPENNSFMLTGPAGVTKSDTVPTPAVISENSGLASVIATTLVMAGLIILLAMRRRKFNVLLVEVGPHRRKVSEIIKRYTKINASDSVLYDVFDELSGKPLVLIEGISKGRANKIVAALKAGGAEAKTRMHRIHKKK